MEGCRKTKSRRKIDCNTCCSFAVWDIHEALLYASSDWVFQKISRFRSTWYMNASDWCDNERIFNTVCNPMMVYVWPGIVVGEGVIEASSELDRRPESWSSGFSRPGIGGSRLREIILRSWRGFFKTSFNLLVSLLCLSYKVTHYHPRLKIPTLSQSHIGRVKIRTAIIIWLSTRIRLDTQLLYSSS